MSSREKKWFLCGATLIVLNIVLPYTELLKNGPLLGTLLFWCATAIVTILAGIFFMKPWVREKEGENHVR